MNLKEILGVVFVLSCANGFKPRTNGHQIVDQQYNGNLGSPNYATITRKHIYSFRNPFSSKGNSKSGVQFSYAAATQRNQRPLKSPHKKLSVQTFVSGSSGLSSHNNAFNENNSVLSQRISVPDVGARKEHSIDHIMQHNKGLMNSIENLIVDAISTSNKPTAKASGQGTAVERRKQTVKLEKLPNIKNKATKILQKANIELSNGKQTTVKSTAKVNKARSKKVTKAPKTLVKVTNNKNAEKEQAPTAEKEEAVAGVKDVVHSELSIKKTHKDTTSHPSTAKSTSSRVEPTEAPEAPEGPGQETAYLEYMADEYCSCMTRCPLGTVYRGRCGYRGYFGIQRSLCCLDTYYDDDDDD